MMNRRSVFLLFLTFLWIGCRGGVVYPDEVLGKIVMIIARDNFRDEELLVPKEIFEERGYKVVIASSSAGRAKGMLGTEVDVDMVIEKINPAEYDAVIFVGGSGASEYWDDPYAHRIARDTLANRNILAAICIAPVTIANAGLLEGRKATVWLSERERLRRKGVVYTGKAVEVDGLIVTADSPKSAKVFAEAILNLLE